MIMTLGPTLHSDADCGGRRRGARSGRAIPKQIVVDGPLVVKANAAGLLWMQKQFLT